MHCLVSRGPFRTQPLDFERNYHRPHQHLWASRSAGAAQHSANQACCSEGDWLGTCHMGRDAFRKKLLQTTWIGKFKKLSNFHTFGITVLIVQTAMLLYKYNNYRTLGIHLSKRKKTPLNFKHPSIFMAKHLHLQEFTTGFWVIV